jgi:hypothetical protein
MIHCNSDFPSKPNSSKWFSLSDFMIKMLYAYLIPPTCATYLWPYKPQWSNPRMLQNCKYVLSNFQLAGEMYIQKRKEDVPKFCRFLGCPCDSACQLFQHCNGWLHTQGQHNSEHSGQAACAVAPPSAVEHKTVHCESYKNESLTARILTMWQQE